MSWADALVNDAGELPVHTAGPADLAVMPYTSGTTGLPKGSMHTHASTFRCKAQGGLTVA